MSLYCFNAKIDGDYTKVNPQCFSFRRKDGEVEFLVICNANIEYRALFKEGYTKMEMLFIPYKEFPFVKYRNRDNELNVQMFLPDIGNIPVKEWSLKQLKDC